MNTADRSIAQIDTALRRRFVFEEMMPEPKLLKDKDDNELVIIDKKSGEKIYVQKILKAINERIEYIHDREHTIGHSYFMPLIKDPRIEKLDEIFRINIIPLLAEYFYGDWGDIKVVLNDFKIKENEKIGYFINTKKQSKSQYVIKKEYTDNKSYKVNDYFDVQRYIHIYEESKK
jgi:5-methylcytosine-specific restriction protein B